MAGGVSALLQTSYDARVSARTTPHGGGAVSLQALRIEVLEGPDAGKQIESDHDVLTIGTAEGNTLQLGDSTVSRYHLELGRASQGVRVVDLGSTNGTLANGVVVERAIVLPGTTLTLGRTALRVDDGTQRHVPLHTGPSVAGLVGASTSMRRLMARIETIAKSDVSVHVTGESGTGKEVVARAIHTLGGRASGPFVTLDCGVLTPTLVASELFGHEKGAFTGADRQHVGAFERADGGTLFLDEIGELPASLQPMLLGALERKRFTRVGGRAEIACNVRVISATNRDLRTDVNAGTFRLDLYYRLAVITLHVPPLRERREDVPILLEHFLREAGHDGPVEALFPRETLAGVVAHSFPGNVRELRNIAEAAIALGEAPPLEGTSLSAPGGSSGLGDPFAPLMALTYKDARSAVLSQFEHRYLDALMARAGDNVSEASRLARLDRSHLRDLLKRHGKR